MHFQMQRIQDEAEESVRVKLAKDIGKLENRISEVETSVKQKDEQLENKLQTVNKDKNFFCLIMVYRRKITI